MIHGLSERALRILHSVVVEFIDTGEPVGSRTLAHRYGFDLSPASIRNVLAELEGAGFLYQPHASAGRLPTDAAFRLFVDALMTETAPSDNEQEQIHALDRLLPGTQLLQQSAAVLSALTGTASIILWGRRDRRRLLHMHFVRLSAGAHTLLAVLAFRDDTVETRFLDLRTPPADAEIERMQNLLDDVVRGLTLQQVRDRIAGELARGRVEADDLEKRALELGQLATEPTDAPSPQVLIEGQSRLLDQPDFNDVSRLRDLARVLEDRARLVALLDRTMVAPRVQVLLGREAGIVEDGAISVVAAPFAEDGEPIGTIGVLGPTRMNYPRVVPLVCATATAVSCAHDRVTKGSERLRRKPKRT